MISPDVDDDFHLTNSQLTYDLAEDMNKKVTKIKRIVYVFHKIKSLNATSRTWGDHMNT